MAQCVVHQVVQVLAPDCGTLFITDGFKGYAMALLTHYGHWVQPPRRRANGLAPKARWMPLPQLLYAQVVKQYRRRRLVGVRHRVVFGTLSGVKHVLASRGWQINTAFIERVNLTIRQHVAAVGRRVIALCKGEGAYGNSSLCIRSTITSVCRTPPCANPSRYPSRPMARVRPRYGGRARRPWRLG